MTDKRRSGSVNRRLLMIGGLVLLVAFAVTAGLMTRWWQQNAEQATPKPFSEVVNDAQDKASAGDYDAAHQTIKDGLANTGLSNEEKADLYAVQGNTYRNQGNDQQALESYKQAAAAKPATDLYVSMAEVSEQLNDPAAAIEYYRQAIAAITDDNPVGAADKEAFELRIKELQKQ